MKYIIIIRMFGNWINYESLIENKFNEEFPHIIINNFLSDENVEKVYKISNGY